MRVSFSVVGLLTLAVGCSATQRREQYYMVVEPGEDSAALYRVTAKLTGLGPTKYKLNEGYVPVNVIDALSGKVGEPPDLFSPVAQSQRQAELNDQIDAARATALLSAKAASGYDVEPIDNMVRFFGALKAAAAMSDNEQISIGQTGSSDPFSYRKLVFYASTKVVSLQEFEQELNEIEKSTSALAKAIIQAKQAEAQRTQAKIARRSALRQSVLGQIQTLFANKPQVNSWNAQDILSIFGAAGQGAGS